MIISIEPKQTWTPSFSENLALPETERIVITYNKPLAYKRSEWQKTVGFKHGDNIDTYIDTDRRAIILDSNVSIKNLEIEENGKVKTITTGEELLNCRSDIAALLVTQICNQIVQFDLAAELKN